VQQALWPAGFREFFVPKLFSWDFRAHPLPCLNLESGYAGSGAASVKQLTQAAKLTVGDFFLPRVNSLTQFSRRSRHDSQLGKAGQAGHFQED
jgi:hypothetical protein